MNLIAEQQFHFSPFFFSFVVVVLFFWCVCFGVLSVNENNPHGLILSSQYLTDFEVCGKMSISIVSNMHKKRLVMFLHMNSQFLIMTAEYSFQVALYVLWAY